MGLSCWLPTRVIRMDEYAYVVWRFRALRSAKSVKSLTACHLRRSPMYSIGVFGHKRNGQTISTSWISKVSSFPAKGWLASKVTLHSETSVTVTPIVQPSAWRLCSCWPTFGFKSTGSWLRSTTITLSFWCGPYALFAGTLVIFDSPGFIPIMAFSKPGITWPSPIVNCNGSRSVEVSNTVPSSNLPV